jgi:hypothetical protein
MENEKKVSGDTMWDSLRQFAKDSKIVFVTPTSESVTQREIDLLPNVEDISPIRALTECLYKLPTLDEMMTATQIPDGGFRRGELTIVAAKGRYPTNPMSAYRMLNLGMKDPNAYKLDEILGEDLPKVKLMFEDCDRLYEKKPQAKED